MIYEKIMNVSKALSCLADQVPPEAWAVLRMAKTELMDAADQARSLEQSPIYTDRIAACREVL